MESVRALERYQWVTRDQWNGMGRALPLTMQTTIECATPDASESVARALTVRGYSAVSSGSSVVITGKAPCLRSSLMVPPATVARWYPSQCLCSVCVAYRDSLAKR